MKRMFIYKLGNNFCLLLHIFNEKDGRKDGWKEGRKDESGRMEEWKWKDGRMDGRKYGRMDSLLAL